MNEFYETVANFLEEIRCDSEERKYAVAPEDMKESVAEMKKMQKKYEQKKRIPFTGFLICCSPPTEVEVISHLIYLMSS